jgi:hypothetical protein
MMDSRRLSRCSEMGRCIESEAFPEITPLRSPFHYDSWQRNNREREGECRQNDTNQRGHDAFYLLHFGHDAETAQSTMLLKQTNSWRHLLLRVPLSSLDIVHDMCMPSACKCPDFKLH